jgi:Rrf2 family transcriptional regulator, nitric oxide-sensitive transcriptional repressor
MSTLLRISDATSLALHSVVLLAGTPDRPCPTADIALSLHASEAHLSKVLQRLAHSGLVRSSRGPGGGFALGRPPDQITLLEVYEAVEGPLTLSNCLLERPACDGTHCILGGLLETVNRQVVDYLASTRVGDLIGVYRCANP